MTSIDIEDIEHPERSDFRRANGAPMIIDRDGKNQRFSRPSGWGKELDDENALVNWKINRAIEGVSKDKALQARGASLDPDGDREDWSLLREAAINAGKGAQAADIGTALHKMSDRWEQEKDFDPGAPYTAHLEAYEAEMKRLGLISQRFEFKTVNEEYRTAGTADRLYELSRDLPLPNGEILPRGTLVIGDMKTGEKLDYSIPAYSIQLAIYAQGQMYDIVSDQFMPTPEINQDWAIISWLPSKGESVKCEMLWVDLQAGNYGAWLVHEIRQWRKDWRNGKYAAPKIGDPVKDVVEEATDALLEAFEGVSEIDFDETLAFTKARLEQISQHPEAKKKVQLFWPENVPPPSKTEAVSDLLDANEFLDKIEAEFGLTFVSGDPRTASEPGKHLSAAQAAESSPA